MTDALICQCGHDKRHHYFGDRLGADGQMHTWCQMDPPLHCGDFRAALASQPAEADK